MSTRELPASQKLRGGYYTPAALADWLCRWGVRSPADRILEPSCGDGSFLAAGYRRLRELGAGPRAALKNMCGVDIVAGELRKVRSRLKELAGVDPNGQLACGDFFEWSNAQRPAKFDCAVGNPPFIRYQNFPEPSRSLAMQLLADKGLRANKLTNIWVPFVVGAADLLKDGGRLAFVLPAELLQVSYAAQLRLFLAEHFERIHLFACNHLFFENAEQEVVLLLAEGYSAAARAADCLIEMRESESVAELLASEPNSRAPENYSRLDHSTEKWLAYFLSPKEISCLRAVREHAGVAELQVHAEVDVGVVTGRNEFFVIGSSEVEQYGLQDYVVPLVGRSAQLRGAVVEQDEWQRLAAAGERVWLLSFGTAKRRAPSAAARRYLALGESQGIHTGYKCSIRKPWHVVPSVWQPDCFLFRQIYDFPRMVLNRAAATSTDTIHRVRCKADPRLVAANLYTHLSAASAEVAGRSYGGGVLELEPNEAERVLVPRILQDAVPLDDVDRLVRRGEITTVLKENDRRVLRAIGLSAGDRALLAAIWQKMRSRRTRRTRKVTPGAASFC